MLLNEFKQFRVRKLKGELNAFRRESLRGANGSSGSDGRNGIDGKDGANGLQGLPGPRGEKGDSIKGDKGDRGLQGLKGETGAPPEHRWDGTKLSFKQPNGVWGEWIELKGATGEDGKSTTPAITPKVFSTSIAAVRGLQAQLDALNEANMQYTKLIDTVGTTKYIGEASPGTATSAALWRIKLVDLTDEDIEIQWADGVGTFTKVWDDRAGYSYS